MGCERIRTHFRPIIPTPTRERHDEIRSVIEYCMGRLMSCREALAKHIFAIVDKNTRPGHGVSNEQSRDSALSELAPENMDANSSEISIDVFGGFIGSIPDVPTQSKGSIPSMLLV